MPPNIGLVMFTDTPDMACKLAFGNISSRALACATVGPDSSGVNRMILPNPCLPVFQHEFYAQVACHELRHWHGEMHAPGSPRFADGG